MGYIFDALNQSNAGPQGRDDSGAPGLPGDAADPIDEVFGKFKAPPPPAWNPDADSSAGPATAAPDAIPISTPLAGVTPEVLEGIDDRIVALTEPATVMAEEYRSIRTSLLARWQQRRNLVHTISSATPQEGKTITSLNLGFIFAELRNRRTLVIEADLRLPQFEVLLSLPSSPGLVGVLEGEADLKSAVLRVGSLDILPAGRALNDKAVQLLSSAAMPSLLARVREKYDHVIIDTPPVLEMADAGILGAMSDDVLLVARLERTPRDLVERAIRTLGGYNAPVAGVIATDQKHCRHHNYYKHNSRDGKYYHKKAA